MDRNIPSDQQQQQQHPQAPMYLQFPPVLGSSSSTEASLLPDTTTTSTLSDADRARKRNAQLGQWRTPPQPFFPSVTSVPSGNSTVVANTSAPSVDMTDVSGLDLASLQEAYRRGMAAAAALSKHQMETGQAVFHPTNNNNEITTTMTTAILPDTTNLSTAQSCPNFQRMQQQQQQQQQQQSIHNPAIATTTATLPPAYAVPYPATATPRTTSTTTTTAPTFKSSARVSAAIPAVTRSISLPDMSSSSNNNKATTTITEEEKRIKRLARNRASARLRRLRKKNLVESYEEQVTVLEQALTKLQSHTWGGDDTNNSALLEALSMERGQQPLTAEKRREVVQQILNQQREQVQNLMDIQMESWMLRWLAEQHSNTTNTTSRTGLEEIQLAEELQNVLNLSTEQMEQLKQATEGINEEKEAIETVSLCLEAMMNNGWLVNQEVEDTIEQFCSILNPSQMSKFLLWTDHNSEAIEQLDFVNAPAESSLPANSPNFTFGIDDLMGGGHPDDGEEAKG